jgi:HKD family nuclease
MIVEQLGNILQKELAQAQEIWIAVALMTDEGFSFIRKYVAAGATEHYVIGVDLLTDPNVLKRLKSRQNGVTFRARVYNQESGIFHPKAYIIKKRDGYVAFVGSANLTQAALRINTELTVQITNAEECARLINWHEAIFNEAFDLTDSNLENYTQIWNSRKESAQEAAKLLLKFTNKADSIDPLVDIDFSDRYFTKNDHLAFRRELWSDDSPAANKERKIVQKHFLELHELIFPKFGKVGLTKLFPNVRAHIVSMFHHVDGRTEQDINAMWLSYGKSQKEIRRYHELFPSYEKSEEDDKQSFINHARLQIRIELTEIGIWILFGKNNNGSLFDRKFFFDSMKSSDYRANFFQKIKSLPTEYWISVNGKVSDVASFENPDQLHTFCLTDDPKHYFIIGRDYKICAPEMAKNRLPDTVLTEFARLYPLYIFMRHFMQ